MSASWPLQEAIEQALTLDGTLSSILSGAKVYSTLAPVGTSKPYIVMGTSSEYSNSTFTSDVIRNRELMQIWGRDKKEVLTIYDHVRRILHRKKLYLNDQIEHIQGRTELLMVLLDEDRVSYQALVQYDATNYES